MRLLPQTIRGEFVLFAFSLALPLVALIGYGLYDRTRDDVAASEAIARRLAVSNADRVSEFVAGLRTTLEAVARRPLVRAMDAARCDPRLADLVDLYPRAGSLIVVDREGVILCSSRPMPRDRVVRIADEELLSVMLADPRFRVSKPIVSRLSSGGHWIVSAVQPVFGEGGALVGTVAMATDLVQWNSISLPGALPVGAIVTVVTADGTIIARSADAEKWISRKLWDERLMKQVLEMKEGVIHALGADGSARVIGVKAVAGHSMQRICAPVFLLAILLSGVCYFVNVDLAPYAKSKIKRLFYDLALDDPSSLFQPGKILDRFPGYRIFTSAREGNKLKDVEIFETDAGFDQRYIRARQAEVVVTPGVTDFVLKLYKCHIEAPKVEGLIDPLANMDNADAGEMSIIFPLSKLKEKTERVTASMKDTDTLWREVRTGKDAAGNALPVKVISASRTEANMRYSFSLACITFCLVGIPLGITAQRRETSVGFALSLVVATCYIVFIIFANTMNEDPKAYPHLLMWIPNVIFMTVGAVLFRRLMKK